MEDNTKEKFIKLLKLKKNKIELYKYMKANMSLGWEKFGLYSYHLKQGEYEGILTEDEVLYLLSKFTPRKKPDRSNKSKKLIQTLPPTTSNAKEKVKKVYKGRHVDFLEKEVNNKKLGDLGESLVFDYEKSELERLGRCDLADQVEWVSKTKGDGLGYDILSFTSDGKVKYIEVKTTCGNIHTPFMISLTELEFSRDSQDKYFIYRVYEFSQETGKGKFYVIQGEISNQIKLEPILYKARL